MELFIGLINTGLYEKIREGVEFSKDLLYNESGFLNNAIISVE